MKYQNFWNEEMKIKLKIDGKNKKGNARKYGVYAMRENVYKLVVKQKIL